MRLKSVDWKYIAFAFLLPMTGLLVLRMICTLTFEGTYSMLYSDMYHQYYPFFVAFRKALLSGDSLLYSWSTGMGMDYLGLISYYLASPLNLLTVAIPESWMLGYFSFLMPLKLSFASLFFAFFLKQLFGKNDFSIVLFGTFYALCAWALGYQWNIMWLDTFALLPLVMLGMVELLNNRKFLLYTISLFFAIGTNYYIGYFICIFVFLSFFCFQICYLRGWKRFFSDFLYIALFSLIAIGLTAFITIPAIFSLKTVQSRINTFPVTFRLNIAKEHTLMGLLDAMRQVAGNMNGNIELTFKEGLPNVCCGIITNVLAFLFLTAKDIKLRDKLCSVFLLILFNISFIIRQLDFIWHGFHFTNMIPYRFSFLYSFVLLVMAYRAWLLREKFTLWQILTACVLSIGLVFCGNQAAQFFDLLKGDTMILSWTSKANITANLKTIITNSGYILFNLLFIGAYVAAFLLGRKKITPSIGDDSLHYDELKPFNLHSISKFALWGIMGIELVFLLTNFGIWFPGVNLSNYPKGTRDSQAVIDYMVQRESDTPFYRAETTHTQTLNDGALNGYNGVSTFTSSANVKVTEFMQKLGYGAKNTYNRYSFEESSPVANLFLNLKYMIDRDGTEKENPYFDSVYRSNKVQLLENNAYLPLGFLANAQIVNIDFDGDDNPFEFQNRLMTTVTGEKENCWNVLSGYTLTILGDNTTLQAQNETGYCSYEVFENAGTVTYRYITDQEGLLCFYVDQSKRNNFSVYLNGAEKPLFTESYSLPQMLSVCQVYPGDMVEIRFNCSAYQVGTINLTTAVLNDTVYRNCYNILSKSTLKLSNFSTNYISGTINCDRDGVMYTSIPQDGNWKATVDGHPAQIHLIGDAMIGLNLSEGNHTVTFTYHNRAFSLGWKISVVCLGVLIGCYFAFYHPSMRRKKGRFEK